MKGIIYKATNIKNGRSYIGQTIQELGTRKKAHFSEARRSKFYFHKALLKYGKKNFKWTVLEKCNSKEELDEMEFHYIKQFNTFRPNGYNLTFGGDGTVGYVFTTKDRLKMSNARKGRKMSESARLKLIKNHADFSGKNNPMYGVTSPMKGKNHTEETKIKISKKLKGKKHSEDHKRKLSDAAKRRWRRYKNEN